jgi:hypothetical protein
MKVQEGEQCKPDHNDNIPNKVQIETLQGEPVNNQIEVKHPKMKLGQSNCQGQSMTASGNRKDQGQKKQSTQNKDHSSSAATMSSNAKENRWYTKSRFGKGLFKKRWWCPQPCGTEHKAAEKRQRPRKWQIRLGLRPQTARGENRVEFGPKPYILVYI